MRLKTIMSARGLANATFFLDGRELEQAVLHGESGTRVELASDVLLAEKADGAAHVLEIAVENRGFVPERTAYWPERRRGVPADEGSEFYLQFGGAGLSRHRQEPDRSAGLAAAPSSSPTSCSTRS